MAYPDSKRVLWLVKYRVAIQTCRLMTNASMAVDPTSLTKSSPGCLMHLICNDNVASASHRSQPTHTKPHHRLKMFLCGVARTSADQPLTVPEPPPPKRSLKRGNCNNDPYTSKRFKMDGADSRRIRLPRTMHGRDSSNTNDAVDAEVPPPKPQLGQPCGRKRRRADHSNNGPQTSKRFKIDGAEQASQT
jgi:hypothetical protein